MENKHGFLLSDALIAIALCTACLLLVGGLLSSRYHLDEMSGGSVRKAINV
ncbi:MAG: hypothetical protein ACLSA6_11375 [Holdemania massiliensis]